MKQKYPYEIANDTRIKIFFQRMIVPSDFHQNKSEWPKMMLKNPLIPNVIKVAKERINITTTAID